LVPRIALRASVSETFPVPRVIIDNLNLFAIDETLAHIGLIIPSTGLEMDKYPLDWLSILVQFGYHVNTFDIVIAEEMCENLEDPFLRDVVEHTRNTDAGIGDINLGRVDIHVCVRT